VSDYRTVPVLLDVPVAKPKALLDDRGYDGGAIREDPLWRGILPIIPPKANRRQPPSCDFRRYRDSNHVERLFNRLKPTCSSLIPKAVPLEQLRHRGSPVRHRSA
jgi:hypothetical protein